MNPVYEKWYEKAKEFAGSPKGLLGPDNPDVISLRWDAACALIRKVGKELLKGVTVEDALANGHPKLTLLDVGCGYADLAGMLSAAYDYTGIEAVPWIYEEAMKCSPNDGIWLCDLKTWAGKPISTRPKYDIVVALGVMATLDVAEDQQFAEDCMALARHAVIVSYQDERYEGAFRKFTNEQVMELFATPIMRDDAVISGEWDTQTWAIIRTK